MKFEQIPNIITVFRLILVVPFLYALLTAHYYLAFGIFVLAGISDAIDGYLARYFQLQSHFGAFLDPLADKVLMITSFFTLNYLGMMPWWITVLVISRDIIIMSGVAALNQILPHFEYKPTLISKINTVFQIGLVGSALFNLAFAALPTQWIPILIILVTFTTTWSLLGYVLTWGRIAWQYDSTRPA